MKQLKSIASGHEWHKSVMLRAFIVFSSFVGFVLASGAGTQWMGG